jgi:hypothetical protein
MTNAKRNVNIYFHVVILFIFLTSFFFTYLARVQSKAISSSITGKIPQQVNSLLTNLDFIDKKLFTSTYPNIKWDAVKELGLNIAKPDQSVIQHIQSNNKDLLYTSIGIIIALILGLIGMIIYHKIKNHDLNVGAIVLENIVIFMFIGIVEYLFFAHVASKYIPTTPYNVSETLLDGVASKLEN